MKRKSTLKHPARPRATLPDVLRDAVALPGVGVTLPVRVAKAKLSALLDLAASGQEIVITSDGTPKAVLLGAAHRGRRRVFKGTLERLRQMPVQVEKPFAEELIRQDREGRGW